jgi:transcriptional regulator
MYVPEKYRAPSREPEHELIERFNFGLLVATLEGRTLGVHVPFLLDRHAGELGALRAHFALQNPLARLADGAQVMVVFQGPHSYITPEDYVTEIHFPTWCYSAVHVYGRLRWLESAELDAQVANLIANQEALFSERAPWTLARAPEDLYQEFRKMITGLEIVIDDLQGCFKLNQNKQTVDVRALIDALRARGGERNALLADDLERHNAERLAALAAEEAP